MKELSPCAVFNTGAAAHPMRRTTEAGNHAEMTV